jgi:hypothetical protein
MDGDQTPTSHILGDVQIRVLTVNSEVIVISL